MFGGAGNDVLDAGAGVTNAWQQAHGQAGNDTYHVSSSSGLYWIGGTSETATSGSNDKMVFKDLNLSDFTLGSYDYGSGSVHGNSLRMHYTHSGGGAAQVAIANMGAHIEEFVFADGTTMTAGEVWALV